MRSRFLAGALALLTAIPAAADFSYEQSSKMTGGAMAAMMKMAGVFSKAHASPCSRR